MEKNNYKILSTIFAIIFVVIFSLFNFDEYKEFHQNKTKETQNKIELTSQIEKFELKNVKELKDVQFYYTPYKILLTNIIEKVDNSKKEIFLETYMLTEKKIQASLIRAHKRGVKIKVLLEKDPYKAYNINNKAFNKLSQEGIDIIRSKKSNYSFNHTKVLIIDDLSIISTGNYSYSTFSRNRDFFIFTTDKNIKNKLVQNFENDYKGNKVNIFDENLVFSPKTSRIKFEKMFDTANKSIKMYFQYLKDDDLVDKLIKIKKEKNIDITVIIPETALEGENTIRVKKAGINVQVIPKYKMHAKAILIDDEYLFIGSINFSHYSIDRNREVGIILKNKKIINDFLNIFNKDLIK